MLYVAMFCDCSILFYVVSCYVAVIFFEGSVTEPRRTFVADLVADLCNKTRWLVTHPSLHTLVTHLR